MRKPDSVEFHRSFLPIHYPTPPTLNWGRYLSTKFGKMLRTLVKNNAGFLLVVASEVFFAFMHASVKVLMTEGESAIPVLEVLFYN